MQQRRPGRTLAWLTLLVAAAHLWLASEVLDDRLGKGAASHTPRRIVVAFVRELQQQTPAPVIAAPPPAPRRAAAIAPPAPAASSPPLTAPVLEPVPSLPSIDLTARLPEPPVPLVEAPRAAEPVETSAASAAASPTAGAAASAFEWPPSTRLSYRVTGDYRGPVEGQAQVEWVRSGSRYQVHLDVGIGPSFAPLVTRRMSSDGEITADGLRPRRYDEETRVALRSPRALTIHFDDGEIRLPNGQRMPLPPGVQDAASQFVQMTWMFTLDPSRLQLGRTIEMPLALPRRVEPWIYDVIGRETLDTPAGAVETVHVKPRRIARPGVDLTAEMWIAPSLQYLPVRIIIRQDRDTYADMLIERLPQQSEAPAAAQSKGR